MATTKVRGTQVSNVALLDAANIFTANQRVNAGLGINVAPPATGALALSGGVFERSRPTAMGDWTDVAYNSANFTAGGSMIWTVDSGDVLNYSWAASGHTVAVALNVQTTSTSGTAHWQVELAIPNSFVCTKATTTASLYLVQSGTATTGVFDIAAGATKIRIYKSVSAPNWALSTNDISIQGIIAFQVN